MMRRNLRNITLSLAVLFLFAASVPAQTDLLAKPRTEKLLNDLNVVIWSRAGTGRVTVKLRIHNGTAYDPLGKEGTLALLGEILFPEENIREFFREDLDGSLDVVTTYDYIEVTATARADAFLTVLETIAPALMNTEIDKEITGKVKARQKEKVLEAEMDRTNLAKLEAARRLYGDFPYGRPIKGTSASLSNIDFADLIFARERYLTADNATLVIAGDVRSDYAYLAARRLMGGWNKSGTNIPATFRLPEGPSVETKMVFANGGNSVSSAAEAEGFARKHALYHPAEVLGHILDSRLRRAYGSEAREKTAFVEHRGFLLRGSFVAAVADSRAEATDPDGSVYAGARSLLEEALKESITQAEFDAARSAYISAFTAGGPEAIRLDVETYSLGSVRDEYEKVRGMKLTDVQKAADTLASRPKVEVIVVSRPAEAPDQAADPKDPSR